MINTSHHEKVTTDDRLSVPYPRDTLS